MSVLVRCLPYGESKEIPEENQQKYMSGADCVIGELLLTTFEKYMHEKGSCTQLVLQQLQNKLHIFVARFTVA